MPYFSWYCLNRKMLFSEFNISSDCLKHSRAQTYVTSTRHSNQQVPLRLKSLLLGAVHDLCCSFLNYMLGFGKVLSNRTPLNMFS